MENGNRTGATAWSQEILKRLHTRRPLRHVLHLGTAPGVDHPFRQPGQAWTSALNDRAPVLDWTANQPIDLVVCGDALDHLTKADALALLHDAAAHARVVVVSLPFQNAGWSHKECLGSLPHIAISQVDHAGGIYLLSGHPEDRASLLYSSAQIDTENQSSADEIQNLRAAVMKTPGDIQLLYRYCSRAGRHSMEEVVATLEEICRRPDQPPGNRIQQLGHLVFFKERVERLRRGLPISNALSPEDITFRFTGKEIEQWQATCCTLLDAKPTSHGGLVMMGFALLAQGRTSEADVFLTRARDRSLDINTAAIFNADFHADLESAARASLEGELPRVRQIVPPSWDAQSSTVFMACDGAYFETYGWILARSFADKAPDIKLALHVYDVTAEEAETIRRGLDAISGLSFAISCEWSGVKGTAAARGYYHAVRFLRLSEYLDRNPAAPVWLVDADTLFINTPQPLFQALQGHDVGLWMAPGRMEPHSKITAALVGIGPTAAGRSYIRRVGGYIAKYQRTTQLLWGIDQAALYAVYANHLDQRLALGVAMVTPDVQDESYRSDVVFWSSREVPNDASYDHVRATKERYR